MDVGRCILYMECVLLALIWVKATTISVDEDHCGGNISLDVNDSLFLNYYGADLNENGSDRYHLSKKKCIFKISASRSSYEICIRYKDPGPSSFFQLSKCNLVFKYYMGSYGPYSWYSKNCGHFEDDPLCTNLDTVYAVYEYYTHVNYLYEGLWLEFEIYLRKPPAKREEQGETWSSWSSWSNSDTSWSSWSDSDTSADSDEDSVYGLFFLLCTVCFISCLFCTCCCCGSSDKPDVSVNTQNTEPVGHRDNPFRNVQADGHSTRIVNRYRTEGPPAVRRSTQASEDPWKPPEYESVVLLDQSFYGDSKPSKVYVSKETGPDNTEDLDDPPPPYPGV